jgi:hypothetical protein
MSEPWLPRESVHTAICVCYSGEKSKLGRKNTRIARVHDSLVSRRCSLSETPIPLLRNPQYN